MKLRNSVFLSKAILIVIILILGSFIFTFAADTNEPNNTSGTATTLSVSGLATEAVSYISTNTDVDWYKINITHPGLYSCTLTNSNIMSNVYGTLPADYDLDVFNSSLTNLTYSYNRGTTMEKCYFSANSAGTYYFRVQGYLGAYNATAQYRLYIAHGDAAMITEAAKFRDYYGKSFYDRQVQSGTGINNYKHIQGVAYGYGSKDSLSHYITDIASATTNAIQTFDRWDRYNFPSYPRPGRYDGDTTTTKNCGIDCSGLVQRAAQAAGTRYKIARNSPLDSGDGLSGNWVPAANFGTWSTSVTNANLEAGDIGYKTGHVFLINKIDPANVNNCTIIEAAGDPLSAGGRKVKESPMSKYPTGYTKARLLQ